MDRFFDQQNIERYRQLASASTSGRRKSLLTLLAAEKAEFKRGTSSQATPRLKGSLGWKDVPRRRVRPFT
jgi:hypothetical protein